MFYKSCIQSVSIFSFVCWFGNVSQKDKNKLQRVINISNKITALKQSSLTALCEKQVLRKANKIINDNTHNLYNEYVLLPSSRRFRTIISKTNRMRDSFIPKSVQLLNDTLTFYVYVVFCFFDFFICERTTTSIIITIILNYII